MFPFNRALIPKQVEDALGSTCVYKRAELRPNSPSFFLRIRVLRDPVHIYTKIPVC